MRTILLTKQSFFGSQGLSRNTGTRKTGKTKLASTLFFLFSLFCMNFAFAQIAHRASSTATTTNTTLTITKPAGLAVGDVMIANIMQSGSDNNSLSNPTATGWTLIAASNMDNGNSRYRGSVYYRIATATEVAAANFGFTLDSDSDDGQGGISAFSGVDIAGGVNESGAAGGPFDVDPGSAFTGIASDNTYTATSITTASANAAVILIGIVANDTNSGTYNTTSPGTLTELYDEDFNATLDIGIASAWGTKTTAGATGSGTANLGQSATNGALLIALKRFTGTISTGVIAGSPFCNSSEIAVTVPYTITGTYASGNVFTAQLSNSAGSFASPTNIGTVTATAAGNISATIPAGTAAGTGYRIRVISSFPPATGADNGSNLTITAAPTAVAGTISPICETTASVNVTTGSSATNNAGITWSTPNGTGTFANANSLTTATYTPSAADIAAGSVTIRLTATANAGCANAVSDKTLTISKAPIASAGGSATICSNQSHQVSGASSSNGTILWTENGAGSIQPGTETTLTPIYNAAAGDAGNTVTLTMTVSNSPCTAATATYSITVVGAATAVAGTPVSMCETAGSVNVTNGASSTNNAGVLWTSSGTGTWTGDNTLLGAVYTPSAADMNAGSVTITLTATGNAPCGNATSNKTLTLYKQPTAAAGGSATICQNQTHQVSGASSSNGTIVWTENGAGTITAGQGTLTPTYSAAAGDAGNTVTLTLTVSNGTCTPATATYTIDVLALPTAAAGAAFSTCANSGTINITAGSSASNMASVLWTSSGTGIFSDANSLTLATYTPSAGDISAGSVTLTLTAFGNGSCNNATSNKVLTILPIPEVTDVEICQGGASQTMNVSSVCPNNPPVTPAARFSTIGANSGTGSAWGGTGNLTSDNNSNATVSGSTSNAVVSQALHATGYGFSIPSDAVVTGIQATAGRYRSGGLVGGEVQDNSVRLLKAGSAIGDNKGFTSTNWGTSESAISYGGTTDMWGTSWTAAEINASNFGVAFVVDISQSLFGTRTANIDYITLTVTYYMPSELQWYTVSSGGTMIGTGASFDPVGVLNSGLADTNTPGTTVYYVECSTIAGCRTPVNYTINPLPTVTITTGLDPLYCGDASAVTITGNHAGGTFTGAGITDNGDGTASFNPATAGVGPHTITYTYTDGNTCVNSATTSTTVNANVTYYQDFDNDGFGNIAVTQVSCIGAPAGYVANSTDCNDNDNTKNAEFQFYVDADGDGFGTGSLVSVCAVDANTPPANYSLNNTDCDDNDDTKNAMYPFYADNDGDTYGAGSAVMVCAVDANTPPSASYVLNDTDCDDNNAAIFTSGSIYIDADADGYDNGTAVVCHGVAAPAGYSFTTNGSDCDDNDNTKHAVFNFYADTDNDGYGAGVAVPLCAVDANTSPQAGFVADNTDCDDTKNTVHPNAVEIGYNLTDDDCDGLTDEGFPPKVTQMQSVYCNATLPALDSQIMANLVAGAQGYRWRITTMTGPNAGQVQTLDTGIRVMKLTQLVNYAFSTQYKVEVAVYYAGYLQPYTNSCNINTPAASTQLTNCGTVLNVMSDAVRANIVPYAAGYRFRISDPLNPLNSQELDRSIRDFKMTMITNFVVQYGKTYNVECAVKNTDGTYMPYGAVCTVATPIFPTTSLLDEQCDDYIVPDYTTQLFAISYPGVVAYIFQITGIGLPPQGLEITKHTRTFTLGDFPGLIPGATYNVRVRMVFHESDPAGPFGKVCTVVAPGLSRQQVVKPEIRFNAVAYPNPFADSFNVEIVSGQSNDIDVKVYDMTGRLLETRGIKPADMQSVQLGENYPSGVYNVMVSQGDDVKTLRVIKR